MFAKIGYKQNLNMWKTNFSLQHLKLIMGTKLFYRPKTIFANNFNYFGISEPEVPGTWKLGIWSSRSLGTSELGNFGTSELGNLFKGIPASPDCGVTVAIVSASVFHRVTRKQYPWYHSVGRTRSRKFNLLVWLHCQNPKGSICLLYK